MCQYDVDAESSVDVVQLDSSASTDGAAMLSGLLPKTLREKWQVAMHDSRVAGVGILVVWLGFGRLWRPALSAAYSWLKAISSRVV